MTRRVGAAVAVIVCATQGAALRGDEAQDARIRALADKGKNRGHVLTCCKWA